MEETEVVDQIQTQPEAEKKEEQSLSPAEVRKLLDSHSEKHTQKLLEEFKVTNLDELKALVEEARKPKPEPIDIDSIKASYEEELTSTYAAARAREDFLDAGIRKQDLDYAMFQLSKKLNDMDEESLTKYELSEFIKDMAKSSPAIFTSKSKVAKLLGTDVEEDEGNSHSVSTVAGTISGRTSVLDNKVKDFKNASQKEVDARIKEIMAGKFRR